jgi:hypothetical protein
MSSAAPGSHLKRKTALRAVAYLAAALVPAFALLQWNRPSAKKLEFDFVCDRFQVPMPVALNLNHAPTQMQQVVLSGFDGQVTGVASVSADGSKPVAVPQGKLTLGRTADPTAPYLKNVPMDGLGKMEMRGQKGVILSSFASPGEPPHLEIKSARQGDTRFQLESRAAQMDFERYAVPELFPAKTPDSFSRQVFGGSSLIVADLASGPPQKTAFDASVIFRQSGRELELLSLTAENAQPMGELALPFHGVLNPDLRIDGKSAAGVVTGHAVNLDIDVKSCSSLSLTLVNAADKKMSPALHFHGEVEAVSLRQDGHELLPSLVEDILDKPYTERSLLLVCLGFLALLIFKVVERALDVLIKLLLED